MISLAMPELAGQPAPVDSPCRWMIFSASSVIFSVMLLAGLSVVLEDLEEAVVAADAG